MSIVDIAAIVPVFDASVPVVLGSCSQHFNFFITYEWVLKAKCLSLPSLSNLV
jgi:hypothetical protein